jgi:hypothetical protein
MNASICVATTRLQMGWAFLVSVSREVRNVRQASEYLGISPDTLYRYITEGEIPRLSSEIVGN